MGASKSTGPEGGRAHTKEHTEDSGSPRTCPINKGFLQATGSQVSPKSPAQQMDKATCREHSPAVC